MRSGVLAALVQLSVGEWVATTLPGARSPLTGLGRAVIDRTPGPIVDITVALVEDWDKPLLRANLTITVVAIGATAGQMSSTRPRSAVTVLAAHHILAGVAAATRPDARSLPSLVAAGAGIAAGAITLHLLPRHRTWIAHGVAAATAGTLAILATRAQRRQDDERVAARNAIPVPLPAAPRPELTSDQYFAIDGLSPLHTPTGAFYETDVSFPVPAIDLAEWRLTIQGLVDRPLVLTFDDLLEIGVQEYDATLVCVHNPVGGPRIGTARWLGVPVVRLLEQVSVDDDADQLLAHAIDGFSAGVPLSILCSHRAFVAIGMNGDLLTPGHGYPARLLVPGLYGYDANTKWLTTLELTRFSEVADYWTRRGWPAEPAHVRPGARIDLPTPRSTIATGRTTVAGVAWAPPTGIDTVELSVDGGPWRSAELTRPLHPDAWRQWRIDVDLPPGPHELVARVHAARSVFPSRIEPPYPNGAAGCHRVAVIAASTPGRRARRLQEAGAVANERLVLARDGARAWSRGGWPRRHVNR